MSHHSNPYDEQYSGYQNEVLNDEFEQVSSGDAYDLPERESQER